MKTEELRSMLIARYSGEEWAFFQEVRDATGYSASRSCDAMAFNLWPSKGLEIHGFEIKASRPDWLNELKDPDKADAFKKYCDRWWLVGPRDIIKKGELPPDWGFMWPRAGSLAVSRGAPKLKPEPIDRDMMMSIVRQVRNMSINNAEKAAIRLEAEQNAKKKIKELKKRFELAERLDYKRLKSSVENFENASGIKITDYNGKRLGKLVDVVSKINTDIINFSRMELQLDRLVEGARHARDVIPDLRDEMVKCGLIEDKNA
jgi:hypothetical protein